MTDALILHNPNCSKSRATLALLREHGIEPRVVDYLSDPPDAATFSDLLDALGAEPREALRADEPDYARLRLDDPALTRDQLIALAIAHPHLIQRPIVRIGARAAIGRPPEAILSLL